MTARTTDESVLNPTDRYSTVASGTATNNDADEANCTSDSMHVREKEAARDEEAVLDCPAAQKAGSGHQGSGQRGGCLLGVVVCVLGAIMSSMLQFAFVYGELQRQSNPRQAVSHQHVGTHRSCGLYIRQSVVRRFFYLQCDRISIISSDVVRCPTTGHVWACCASMKALLETYFGVSHWKIYREHFRLDRDTDVM